MCHQWKQRHQQIINEHIMQDARPTQNYINRYMSVTTTQCVSNPMYLIDSHPTSFVIIHPTTNPRPTTNPTTLPNPITFSTYPNPTTNPITLPYQIHSTTNSCHTPKHKIKSMTYTTNNHMPPPHLIISPMRYDFTPSYHSTQLMYTQTSHHQSTQTSHRQSIQPIYAFQTP